MRTRFAHRLPGPAWFPASSRRKPGNWRPRHFAALAAVVGAVVVAGELAAQRPIPAGPAAGPAGPLWVSDSQVDEARRMLIVVDSATRHAAIYHVDAATGSLTLKSTRNLSWDLLMGDFNAREPTPAALQRMLESGDVRPPGPPGRNP